MSVPSIQRIAPGGKAEILVTEVEGIKLNGPERPRLRDRTARSSSPIPAPTIPPIPTRATSSRWRRTARRASSSPSPSRCFPNGVAVEADGSVVWDESYTGHVRRRRPDGTIEDLGRMPGDNPILDGMKIGADGRLYVTDLVGAGIHVLCSPNGTVDGFINGRRRADQLRLLRRDAVGHRRRGARRQHRAQSYGGQLWRLTVPGGGAPTATGSIAGGN